MSWISFSFAPFTQISNQWSFTNHYMSASCQHCLEYYNKYFNFPALNTSTQYYPTLGWVDRNPEGLTPATSPTMCEDGLRNFQIRSGEAYGVLAAEEKGLHLFQLRKTGQGFRMRVEVQNRILGKLVWKYLEGWPRGCRDEVRKDDSEVMVGVLVWTRKDLNQGRVRGCEKEGAKAEGYELASEICFPAWVPKVLRVCDV